MSQSDNFDSYPPLFRPHQTILPTKHSPEPELSSDLISDSDSLPTIDFLSLNPEEIGQACQTWGMFRLVNHGIPSNLVDQIYSLMKKFFSLRFEAKQDLFPSPPMSYFSGTPALSLKGSAIRGRYPDKNWIEGLHVLLNLLGDVCYDDPQLESFRTLLQEYGCHQARLATTLFSTMVEHLKLCPASSKSYLSPTTGFCRIHRYLRCSDPEHQFGIFSHTDSSVLSILHQDEVGGLQVYKDNRWVDVKPIQDTLIVNLGDMAQAISNDIYVSTKHRVRANKTKERFSIGYFIFPVDDAVVESSKYKPFTYADFRSEVQHDVKTVGFKIGLKKFRLNEEESEKSEESC